MQKYVATESGGVRIPRTENPNTQSGQVSGGGVAGPIAKEIIQKIDELLIPIEEVSSVRTNGVLVVHQTPRTFLVMDTIVVEIQFEKLWVYMSFCFGILGLFG